KTKKKKLERRRTMTVQQADKIQSKGTRKKRTKKEQWLVTKDKILRSLLGFNDRRGLLVKMIIYTLLISIGFVYLYYTLYIFITSMKSLEYLLDLSIQWLPSTFYTTNYEQAFSVMNMREALKGSLVLSLVPTFFQVAVASLVGYGFARYEFPLKKLLLV